MKLLDRWVAPIEHEISLYLWETFFDPILQMFEEPIYNSRSDVINAIRTGRIVYRDGVFSGSFNRRISQDLSKYSEFDGRSEVWKGDPPPDVKAAAVVANMKTEDLQKKINDYIDFLDANLNDTVQLFDLPIERPIREMDGQIKTDLSTLAIVPELTDEQMRILKREYDKNQTLTIKDWTQKQTQRLRDMVRQNVLDGSRRNELKERILSEWEVSENKAKFWARQETSLLLSKQTQVRWGSAGVYDYKWSTSKDERVRSDHKLLHGKVFSFSSPPVVDRRTGRRANPGEDYNCRCVPIPVILSRI